VPVFKCITPHGQLDVDQVRKGVKYTCEWTVGNGELLAGTPIRRFLDAICTVVRCRYFAGGQLVRKKAGQVMWKPNKTLDSNQMSLNPEENQMRRIPNTFMVHAWLRCLVVVSVLVFSQIAAHSATWQPGPRLGTARDQFTGGVINGKIYVFGGNRSPHGQNLKSTEMLNPALGKWVYVDSGPLADEELSGAVVNGRLYVFKDDEWGNKVEEYNPATHEWKSKNPSVITRQLGLAVAYNNKIYVFDRGKGDEGRHTDKVEAYDPVNDSWEDVTDLPETIMGYAVAVVADKAYVIGGYSELKERPVIDIYVYNLIKKTWTTDGLDPLPNPRVLPYSSAAPVVDRKIYLIGGLEETETAKGYGPSSKVDIYDTVSKTWQAGVSLPNVTTDHLSVIVNDEIYVVGGNNGEDNDTILRTAAVWKYNTLNHKPTIGTLTPSTKTSTVGVAQTFTATYNDVDGYSDLKTVDFQISPSGTGANAIWARYNSATNKLNLYNNAGTAFVSGSCTPGTAGTLQNSQGKIMCSGTTVTKIKNKVVVKWGIMPKSAFASATAKKIRMIARDQSNATSGWVNKGNWTIQP
jgi:N-acetylneuraminic acid mutarotase